MASKQQIINIKNGSERVIQGLRTKRREFYYDDTLGNVRENLVYSVYYKGVTGACRFLRQRYLT